MVETRINEEVLKMNARALKYFIGMEQKRLRIERSGIDLSKFAKLTSNGKYTTCPYCTRCVKIGKNNKLPLHNHMVNRDDGDTNTYQSEKGVGRSGGCSGSGYLIEVEKLNNHFESMKKLGFNNAR